MATLLADGRILITGGEGYKYPYTAGDPVVTMDNQDVYTPGSGFYWSATNPLVETLNYPRHSHTATLLIKGPDAGKVLIAVGALGTNIAELYDPGASGNPLDGVFTTLADPMHGERHDHTATRLLDGRVLITGGRNDAGSSGIVLSTAEIYNPLTGLFTSTGSMNESRVYHAATNVVFDSATQITCTFDLSGVTTSLGEAWDVKVTNPDTQPATGENLFTIWQPDILEGLVGRYRFNGNADDASGNGNDGTLHGAPTYTQDRHGNPGGAILLDGQNDYVELPNESVFDLSALTIVAVIEVPDYSRQDPIISKGSNFGNYTLHITQGDGKPYYTFQVLGGNETNPLATEEISLHQFIHLAVTYDSSNKHLRGYINGIPKNSLTTQNTPLSNNENVTIGLSPFLAPTSNEHFIGIIDEIRIYNLVLSESEIAQRFAILCIEITLIRLEVDHDQ